MKAKFISTEGKYLEAKISIADEVFIVMDEFGGEELTIGDELEIELSELITDQCEWNDIYSLNSSKEKKLKNIKGWQYLAFGEIISVSPVVVDCGLMKFKEPFYTNDQKCIGEFVGFKVARLSASLKT